MDIGTEGFRLLKALSSAQALDSTYGHPGQFVFALFVTSFNQTL